MKTIRKSQVVRSATADDSVQPKDDAKPEDAEAVRKTSKESNEASIGVSQTEKSDDVVDKPRKLLEMAKLADNKTGEKADGVLQTEDSKRKTRNEEHSRILEKCKEDRHEKDVTAEVNEGIVETVKDTTDFEVEDVLQPDEVADEIVSSAEELDGGIDGDKGSDDGNMLNLIIRMIFLLNDVHIFVYLILFFFFILEEMKELLREKFRLKLEQEVGSHYYFSVRISLIRHCKKVSLCSSICDSNIPWFAESLSIVAIKFYCLLYS